MLRSWRMSKEQKTLKSCYILDRLREWFELYGNQNHQRAEEELHLAIDELYEYQQKDRRIADLEAKLAEKEKEIAYLTKQVKKFNNEAQKYFEDAYCNDFHNQDKISFAVDILEELAGCSNYINSKLDFECGSYVSEKAIRDKIKYLKGKKDE